MLVINTLGIFDSGLGGFSVFDDLRKAYPNLDMHMFADQINAPYGNKSVDEIKEIAYEAMFRFNQQGIDSVLIACNTVSAVALDYLRESFPSMNIWGIIDLTVSQIPEGKSVGLVATQATVDSNAYALALPHNELKQAALVDLVGLIEGLKSDEDILASISKVDVYHEDYLILGCTHFPLVKDLFEKISDSTIVDSKIPIKSFVKNLYMPGSGETKVYTSADPEHMREQIKALFNYDEEVFAWNLSF